MNQIFSKRNMLAVLLSVWSVGAWAHDKDHDKEAEGKYKTSTTSVYELAINMPKEGREEDFANARNEFIEVLQEESAVLADGTWQTFFHFIEGVNPENVVVGITEWKSSEDFADATKRLMPEPVTQNYFDTLEQIAYHEMKPLDGKPFDIEQIQKPGIVVEFAVREALEPEAFGAPRDAFFESLEAYDGYQFAREFAIKGEDNKQAVIIVWDSMEAFSEASDPIFASKEYEDFSSQIEVHAYQATQLQK